MAPPYWLAVSRLRLTPLSLSLAAVVFLLADWADSMAGDSFFPAGALDEIAHFLTMLIVLWALGPRVWKRFGVPALAASVLIDLDHVPQYLGHDFLTQGTPRPYPHSLLTIVVVLVAAALWRRRRDLLLGIALGLVVHLWRDLSEYGSGVALLWPFSDHSFSSSQAVYLPIMGAFMAGAAVRCRRRRHSRARAPATEGAGA